VKSLKPIWDNVYLRALIIVMGAALALYVLNLTRLAWRSFLIALLVAYLVNPLLVRLERRRVPRVVGVSLIMTALVLFVIVALLLLSSILVDLAQLPAALGRSLTQLPNWLQSEDPPEWLQNLNLLADNQQELLVFWSDLRQNVLNWLELNARMLVRQIIQGTQGLVTGLFNLFILFVFIAFTMAGFPTIRQSLYELFPERRQPLARDLGMKLDAAVGGYLRAKVLESGIMFVVSATVLSLLGVPNPLALGLINAMLNPVPYIGPIIATMIEALVALTVSWQLALVTALVMFAIEQIDGNILGPMLLSKGVDVHPVAILSAVTAGGALFGFWGVITAIPVTAFLQLLYRDYYKTSAWYRQRTSPPESPIESVPSSAAAFSRERATVSSYDE
jgi:predicted PurR-regulated permease PerM